MKKAKQNFEEIVKNTKLIINELETVQNQYFYKLSEGINDNLPDKLRLNELGMNILFEYVYNCPTENFSSFADYLSSEDKKYLDLFSEIEEENFPEESGDSDPFFDK
jgi:hypothetical protein